MWTNCTPTYRYQSGGPAPGSRGRRNTESRDSKDTFDAASSAKYDGPRHARQSPEASDNARLDPRRIQRIHRTLGNVSLNARTQYSAGTRFDSNRACIHATPCRTLASRDNGADDELSDTDKCVHRPVWSSGGESLAVVIMPGQKQLAPIVIRDSQQRLAFGGGWI